MAVIVAVAQQKAVIGHIHHVQFQLRCQLLLLLQQLIVQLTLLLIPPAHAELTAPIMYMENIVVAQHQHQARGHQHLIHLALEQQLLPVLHHLRIIVIVKQIAKQQAETGASIQGVCGVAHHQVAVK